MSGDERAVKRSLLKPLRPFYKVFYYCVYVGLGWAVRLLYPLRVIGRQNLRLEKGRAYVLAPNHLRAIDPMYVLLARGLAKKMLVMGKQELFEKSPVLNFFWNVFGAFPVDRGTGNRALLDAAIEEVKDGRGLLIFPEGTRSRDGQLGRLKSGAFVVAQAAGADLIPCQIRYSAGRPKLFRRITVAFGAPVSPRALGLAAAHDPKALREAKHRFAGALAQLYEDNRDKME